ncbi:MAG TPA: hypothetical protein VFW71_03385 [Actinomycetota bacterium]|nr:hypothetical protein [Actinomycetota bacterium]
MSDPEANPYLPRGDWYSLPAVTAQGAGRRGPSHREGDGLVRRTERLGIPLGIFAASRAAVFAALFLILRLPGVGKAGRFLSAGQGTSFLGVAAHGYPHALAKPPAPSGLAFFPLYPMLVRALHKATGISFLRSGLAIGLVASALAMVVLWLIVERVTDQHTASRTIVLLSFFPWGFVFSMTYADGLVLLLCAICLLALLDEQWITAGLAALLAGMAGFLGAMLVLPCAWAAARRFRRYGSEALFAPFLAPLGAVGFFFYLRLRTGNPLAAFKAQRAGLTYGGIGLHPGAAWHTLWATITHPTVHLNALTSILALLLVAGAVVLMVQWRPPLILWLYAAPILLVAVWFNTFLALPRLALAAFPLFIAAARRLRGPAFWAVAAASASLMTGLLLVAGGTTLLVP